MNWIKVGGGGNYRGEGIMLIKLIWYMLKMWLDGNNDI